jgi:hypothetical protein
MILPCRWRDSGLDAFAGRVRFSRRFGYPGRIDDFERVWLTVEGVSTSAELALNARPIDCRLVGEDAYESEITSLLNARNELVIDVTGQVDGGLWGEVALEVRCQAFLRGIRVILQANALQITGTVVGPAERPLELYAVFGRRTVAYATATPTPAGTEFCLTAEIPPIVEDDQAPVLRLDLVNGASVWYTFEQVCALPTAERPQS